VLLDENLDHALRKLLGPHDVATVTYMGWAGLKNGELLQAAENDGFEVLLTGDQTLSHEQNIGGRRLAIIALSAIQLPIIRENLAKVIAAIDSAAPGTFQLVECGTFRRRRPPRSHEPNTIATWPNITRLVRPDEQSKTIASSVLVSRWNVADVLVTEEILVRMTEKPSDWPAQYDQDMPSQPLAVMLDATEWQFLITTLKGTATMLKALSALRDALPEFQLPVSTDMIVNIVGITESIENQANQQAR
jgi:hypothetical protein